MNITQFIHSTVGEKLVHFLLFFFSLYYLECNYEHSYLFSETCVSICDGYIPRS